MKMVRGTMLVEPVREIERRRDLRSGQDVR